MDGDQRNEGSGTLMDHRDIRKEGERYPFFSAIFQFYINIITILHGAEVSNDLDSGMGKSRIRQSSEDDIILF